jgi:hypothetical protein
MSWKQQKLLSAAAIVAALLVNCLPLQPAGAPGVGRVAAASR